MGFGLRKERVLGSSADAKSTAELWSLPTGPKEFPRFRIPCADLTRGTASRANVRSMSDSNNTPIHVRWWVLEDSRSIAALMPGRHHCGIYILEFENNERYVGQARDVVRRYQSHRLGSKHHVAWRDIVGFGFIEVAPSDLDRVEREIIAQQRGRYHLRNRMWNLENTEPSPLDNKFLLSSRSTGPMATRSMVKPRLKKSGLRQTGSRAPHRSFSPLPGAR